LLWPFRAGQNRSDASSSFGHRSFLQIGGIVVNRVFPVVVTDRRAAGPDANRIGGLAVSRSYIAEREWDGQRTGGPRGEIVPRRIRRRVSHALALVNHRRRPSLTDPTLQNYLHAP